MATETEDLAFMEQHFQNAGVEIEDQTNGTDTQSGTSDQTDTTSQTQDQVAGADGKDNVSGKDDGGDKQGKEEKGKGADKAQSQLGPNDLQLKDGTVVKAGQERRWYDQMNLARQRLQTTQNDFNTINQKYNTLQTRYTELTETVKKIGLEKPEDVSAAVALFGDIRRDPVGTVTKLLAELKAKGYSIDGIGSQVDTRAINELLDQRLPKGSEQNSGQKTQEQIAQETEAEITQFIQQFPDALTHEAYIAAVVESEASQGRQISLNDAYFALKEKVIADGFDWSKPLGPQIKTRREGQQQQQGQAPRTPGKAVVNAQSEEIDPGKLFTPKNETTDEIVRAAMREAGIQV